MTATINPRRSAFMVRSVGLGSTTAFGQPVKRATATTATAAVGAPGPGSGPGGVGSAEGCAGATRQERAEGSGGGARWNRTTDLILIRDAL